MNPPPPRSPQEDLYDLLCIILNAVPTDRLYKRAMENLFLKIPKWPGIKNQWSIGEFNKHCPDFCFEDALQDAYIDLSKSFSKGTFSARLNTDSQLIIRCDIDLLYNQFKCFFNLILIRRATDQYNKKCPLMKDPETGKYIYNPVTGKPYRNYPISIDAPIDPENPESRTREEITLPTDSGSENRFDFTEEACEKLRKSCLTKCSDCHCEELSQRVINGERWTEISDDFKMICKSDSKNFYQTVYSHWTKKCLPLLKEILKEYDPELYS